MLFRVFRFKGVGEVGVTFEWVVCTGCNEPRCPMNTTPRLHTQVFWLRRIETAIAEPDPTRSNAAITTIHKELGQALGRLIPGPNFHTWAVWGSSKAGETIRGEGNEQAEWEVPLAAAMIGGLIGLLMAWPLTVVGVVFGWLTARWLIAIGARRAAKQVLAGNRLVLADIGHVTARYLAWFRFDRHFDARKLADFLDSLPDDQHLLRTTFDCYHRARFETDLRERDRLVWEGNCLAVLHEHHKLQPHIAGAMPRGLRWYVTARLLKYRVGSLQLKVSAPLPPARFRTTEPAVLEHLAMTPVRATNWIDLHDRMRYVFALFAAYHSHPAVNGEVVASSIGM